MRKERELLQGQSRKVHNDDFLSSSISISPERKENLKRFLNNLQIDDNPVLKIVYLKKFP